MDAKALKRLAAEKAVEAISSGMVVGLGTGSTAALAVDAIAGRMRDGLEIVGIPTSEATAAQARRLGIPLVDFDAHQRIDLTIDGADAVDPATLTLIKGLGGALLREKIVASASDRMIVIVDSSKIGGAIGSRTPVPVEIVPFGWQVTRQRLQALGADPVLRRQADDRPQITDGGNYIVDCAFGPIADPAALELALSQIVGVIETGLFIGLATEVIVASETGIETIRPG